MSQESKKALRKEMLAIRSSIGAEERARIDADLARNVMSLPEYTRADALFAYLSFGAEVDTRALIEDAWARGIAVALPRCVPGTREMTWHRVESFDGLVRSAFGVDEPADDDETRIDPADYARAIALVPGLTFDPQGYRLGYGGGFYDTFLARFPGCPVGLCRDEQMSQDLRKLDVIDAHDLPVRIIVTNTKEYDTNYSG